MQHNKTHIRFSIWLVLIAFIMSACNPTRDRKINRAWHTLTGHYNVYFNGEQKFLAATEALYKGHKDDFSRTLEVFPYGDEAAAKGVTGQMDEVLKKASLAIQNHTVGKYTDDSYLLIGKAHYFKRDFYAGMESFQYVNSKYKDKGLRPVSTAWIAKCYDGLGKTEEAEAVMGLLLSEFGPKTSKGKEVKLTLKEKLFPPLADDDYREIYATAAHIAIKQKKYNPAINYLNQALKYTNKKPQKIRYTYILGQLYLNQDSIKQATKYFSKILSMTSPYEFEFNASINIARAYDPNDKASVKRVRKSLKRMLNDDKNDGLYDQIHYELAKLEQKERNMPEAIKQYKLSIAKSTKNPNQKALSYLALGNIYLDIPEYKLAQAYYDSTAATIGKDYKDYQQIIDKKNVLSDLISNFVVMQAEDSLQAIAKLSKPEIERKIDQWIAAKKLAEFERKKEEQRQKAFAKEAEMNQQFAAPNDINQGFGGAEQGKWYFYNPTILASGSAEFFSQRKWGRRINEDFWRLSHKEKEERENGEGNEGEADANDDITTAGNNEKSDSSGTGTDAAVADRQEWIKDVPFTSDALVKSNERIRDAYYNIGVIYDEKLSDYKEASKDFETMNKRFPASTYEPEVLYRLHKLYNLQQQPEKANTAKTTLISKYPQNPYALILQNKSLSTAETDANKEVVLFYEKMYGEYEAGNYAIVKSMKTEADKKYPGNLLKPKFELLYVMAVGKTEPISNFKTELELLVKDYPQTDVAERADAILKYLANKDKMLVDTLPKGPEPDFIIEPVGSFYFIFATKAEKFDNNEALAVFARYNEDYASLDNLRINNMMSNEGYQLVMVREFKDLNKAIEYLKGIQTLNVVKTKLKFEGQYLQFVVSMDNFKKMLKEQKIDTYNKVFQEYLPKHTSQKP